jgi:hypothetical protein
MFFVGTAHGTSFCQNIFANKDRFFSKTKKAEPVGLSFEKGQTIPHGFNLER